VGDGNEIGDISRSSTNLSDLDVKSLGKLKQMLEQYEQILKLLQ
jgi:hypothetical protein